MSLEAAIEQNTAALHALLEFMKSNGAAIATQPASTPTEKTAPSNAPAKKAEKPAATTTATTTATPEPPTPTADAVRDLVLRGVAKLGRDPTAAILGKFGAARFPDIKPENYKGLHAALTAELAKVAA